MPHSSEKMFHLVNDITRYPEFLNWCADSSILKQSENQIIASITVHKGLFRQGFTTTNTLSIGKIEVKLLDGPFQSLNGVWQFDNLENNLSRVCLEMEFSFSNILLDLSIAPIFSKIAGTQLDAFILRAHHLYGKNN